jgi:serine/threonine protein kinase/Flp pilus assembly protein TadD
MKQAEPTPEILGFSATAPPSSGPPPDDERVVQAMHEYLARLESGQKPDRGQFLARYPEIAKELADCVDGLEFVRAAGAHAGPGPAESEPTADQPAFGTDRSAEPPLGDYRIIREIGQGGMGVVYEAVQLSLGRRVALKVLPFAAALDSRQLQRFKNEAHAAAQLHHTNIVPVYGVGTDRGIHYYAMQFIDGQTLAQMISRLKESTVKKPNAEQELATEQGSRTSNHSERKTLSTEPSIRNRAFFRTAADLGIQAAEALEHAHQFGVIHRDIKPANLLIENAPAADLPPLVPGPSPLRLWITDFGLAHCQSNAGLTMTGDLVGTLRYMSPEQALAKRVLVDHRTDIYSLGATLYELLTLQPVFGGSDRQELLRQIAFEEPKSPRSVNPAIPSELETIVLKAMEKNPNDRYATAEDLADDLARFLKDEPIRARRPTFLQRIRKLARRHPGVTATAALALVIILVLTALGLAANNLMIRKEQERTQAANTRLQDNLKLSLEALDETLEALNLRMPDKSESAPENEELLTKALGFYEKFAERNQDDPSVRREVTGAYLRASYLHLMLGHYDKAETALGHAAEVARQLMMQFPGELEAKWALAKAHEGKGYLMFVTQGPTTASVEELRKGIPLLEPLADTAVLDPKYGHTLADLHQDLAWNLSRGGKFPEAEKHARQAVQLRRQLVNEAKELKHRLSYTEALALDHNALGVVLSAAQHLDDAEDVLRQSLRLLTQVDTEAGKLPDYRRGKLPRVRYNSTFAGFPIYRDLGATHINLGWVLRNQGRSSKAADEFGRGLACYTRATRDWPGDTSYQRHLATCGNCLGLIWFEGGKRSEAAKQCRKALDLLRTLQAKAPAAHEIQDDMTDVLLRLGDVLHAEGKREEAAQHYRDLRSLMEKMLARSPEAASLNRELAWFLVVCADNTFHDPARAVALAQKAVADSPENPEFLNTLGMAQYRHDQWQAAVATLNKTKEFRRKLGQKSEPGDWFFLAMAHWRLGDKKAARDCYDRAMELLNRYEYPPSEASRWRAEAAALLAIGP